MWQRCSFCCWRTNSRSPVTLKPAHTRQERASPRWFHTSHRALSFTAHFDRKHRMLDNVELSARSGVTIRRPSPTHFPAHPFLSSVLPRTRAAPHWCASQPGNPHHRPSTGGSHTPSSLLSPKHPPMWDKNSQSLPNTECQWCPKPHLCCLAISIDRKIYQALLQADGFAEWFHCFVIR